MLITFSGLDGSGKSTLISILKSEFEKRGKKASVFTMYDHLTIYAVLRQLRDSIYRFVCRKKSETHPTPIKNTPAQTEWNRDIRDPKIGVEDKKNFIAKIIYSIFRNVAVRRIFLCADLIVIYLYRIYCEIIKNEVLITDRFTYDTLADVADLDFKKWGFIKSFLALTPEPDIAILVDVHEELAYKRKGEYPVPYMKWRRAVYLRIFSYLKRGVIINNDGVISPEENVIRNILPRISLKQNL